MVARPVLADAVDQKSRAKSLTSTRSRFCCKGCLGREMLAKSRPNTRLRVSYICCSFPLLLSLNRNDQLALTDK